MESSQPPVLIIPDVHNEVAAAEAIVAAHPGHRVVFLGDYFDAFGDGPVDAARTAEWLGWSIRQPGRIHLIGNHDPFYFGAGRESCWCAGNSAAKRRAALPFLGEGAWEALRVGHWITPSLLCTHAGLAAGLVRPTEPVAVQFERRAADLLRACAADRAHRWLDWGRRGGGDVVGGPLWCDWKDFEPLPGLHQLMGHTPHRSPQVRTGADGCQNILLDASLRRDRKLEYPGCHATWSAGRLRVRGRGGEELLDVVMG